MSYFFGGTAEEHTDALLRVLNELRWDADFMALEFYVDPNRLIETVIQEIERLRAAGAAE